MAALYDLEKPKTTLTTGLVAYYPFNGNANDESGNGNDGEVNGATLAADRNGETGKAYGFDGSSIINTPSSLLDNYFRIGSNFNVSFWFKREPGSQTHAGEILFAGSPGLGPDIQVNMHGGMHGETGKLFVGLYAGEPGISDEVLNDGDWHKVDFGTDAQKVYFYIDSKLQTQQPKLGSTFGENYITFGNRGSLWPGFKGSIDDIRIYNRALSEAEVAALYELEKPKITLTTGLVAYYPFNGNANDESGNGNDGVVNGPTLTSDRFGSSNSAYAFEQNGFINVPGSDSLNYDGQFAISLWISLDQFPSDGLTHSIIDKPHSILENGTKTVVQIIATDWPSHPQQLNMRIIGDVISSIAFSNFAKCYLESLGHHV